MYIEKNVISSNNRDTKNCEQIEIKPHSKKDDMHIKKIINLF